MYRDFRNKQKLLYPELTTPLEYALNNDDVGMIRRVLHKEVLWLLYNYLNATDEWVGCDYPTITGKILELASKDGQNEKLARFSKASHRVEGIPQLLEYYFKGYVTPAESSEARIVKINEDDLPAEIKSLKPLIDPLGSMCSLFAIHGSYATGNAISGWSDVDSLAIVKKDVLQDADKILTLRRFVSRLVRGLFTYDPFQLHGVFIVTEFDLDSYDDTRFPLELFEHSKVVIAPPFLKIKLRNNIRDRLSVFWFDSVSYFLKYADSQTKSTLTSDKFFLHRVFSIPIFYLQALGTPYYKPLAFQEVKKHLSPDELQLFEFFSQKMFKFRFNFSASRFMKYLPFALFYRMNNIFYESTHPNLFFRNDVTDGRIHALAKLSMKLWDKAIKRYESYKG